MKYKFQENKTFEGLNIAFIHTFLRKLAKNNHLLLHFFAKTIMLQMLHKDALLLGTFLYFVGSKELLELVFLSTYYCYTFSTGEKTATTERKN